MQPVTELRRDDRADGGSSTPTNDLATVLDELTNRARALAASGSRQVLGVTGPPGVGKSTVCAAVAARLGSDAALVGMDAFHLADDELHRLQRADRKGAPDTFDVDGYVALLQRLRTQRAEVIYAPRFDRSIEASIGSAVPITRSTPLVITEGNYLLLDTGGWQNVRAELSEVWYLDAGEEMRARRLVRRHESFGRSPAQARAWTEQVDLRNARLIENTRADADLVIEIPDSGSPTRQDDH